MGYRVSAGDFVKIRLNEADMARSVLQNISIILSTWQGSVPLYREFGLPGKFVDKPIPVAKPLLYAEVKEAVETYEPRAEVVDITFIEDAGTPGRLMPIVEVEIING